MWRQVAMGSKPLWTFGVVFALTVTLYVTIALMGRATIDPTVFTAPPMDRPEYRQHGMPIFSVKGVAAWCAIITVYAVIMAYYVRTDAAASWHVFVTVAVSSSVFLSVLHPLIVPLLLPDTLRRAYVGMFMAGRLPFGPSQRILDLRDLLVVGAAPHTVLTYLIVMIHKRRKVSA